MDVYWFSKNTIGIITIYETNITLNTTTCDFLKDAYSTLIGFDKENNQLLIKPLNKEETSLSKYSENDLHRIAFKPSYGRINGKHIIKNIMKFFPLDFSKKNLYKYNCSWDPSQKILIVDLKKEVS